MKFIKLSIIIFLVGIFFFAESKKAWAFDPYRSLCVGIQGTFYANSTWKGGNIEVGCSGDDGGAAPNQSQACTGEVQIVRPGKPFRLTKCSCFGSDKGCMRVGKNLTLLAPNSDGNSLITVVKTIQETDAFKNNSCQATLNGVKITAAGSDKVCGSNGQHITGNIRITCDVPATNTPTPTKGPSSTPTPTTPLPSGVSPSVCPSPGKVTNVKVSCPNCTGTSSSPTLTPTSTQAPN